MLSSRRLLIVGFVGSIVTGIALFAAALGMVALDGDSMGGQTMAVVMLAVMLGLVLDSTWFCLTVDRLSKLGGGGDDSDGGNSGGGGGGPRTGPTPPDTPPGDPEWWPEFEREFRVYSERKREPAVD